jgi:hypothetical protein
VIGETPNGSREINGMETAPLNSARSRDLGDVHALAATVRSVEQQIAGLSRRLTNYPATTRAKGSHTREAGRTSY